MKYILFIAFIMLFFAVPARAQEVRSNNKYGIHLAVPQEEDIKKAAELVNSQGGDWGYITLVMQENDRDHSKWQEIFNQMRESHLIPIIRLATSPEGDYWRSPKVGDVGEWVPFLNSLNWVVKERYIILFNEPNHHSEWGGAVDAEEYAQVSLAFAKGLKRSNPDYYIMLAGLDLSAPSAFPIHEDEEIFLRTVFSPDRVDEWNRLLSGWSSHSYPNPGFISSPTGTGRISIRGYQWEQQLLSRLGVKNLPIFITETGWDGQQLSETTVALHMQYALEQVWGPDSSVRAVTPFILNYQGDPFLGFSWVRPGGDSFYPVYETVQGIAKQSGSPEVIDTGQARGSLPYELVEGSIYRFPINIRNTGQAIWDKEDEYQIKLEGLNSKYYYTTTIDHLEPLQDREVFLYAQTTEDVPGDYEADLWLYKGDTKLHLLRKWAFEIVARPMFEFEVKVFPPFLADSNDYELQIYDEKEQLVFRKKDITVQNGIGKVEQVSNVLFNHIYRIVLLRQQYLPRQGHVLFKKGINSFSFPLTVPIDFNGDGAFNGDDIPALFRGSSWGN